MPALNFPSSPASGDVYSFGNRAWRYDGRAWQAYPSVVQGIADLVVGGDVNVSGDLEFPVAGTFTTTVQTATPTANRVITFPNATGTVGLVGGSTGQFTYNLNGAYAGVPTMTFDGTSVTLAGRLINSYASGVSAPAKLLSGTWVTGGTPTTTKPHFLIEPAGTTSAAWSIAGTGLGVNAASGFAGNLLDLQVNGVSALNFLHTSGATTLSFRHLSGGGGIGFAPQATGATLVVISGVYPISLSSTSLSLSSTTALSWTSGGTHASSADLVLARDAANTLAQRNGTSGQTFRLYNTYTSTTNYELGKLEWSSNTLRFGTEKGTGGGTARDLALQTDGTTRATIKASGIVNLPSLPVYADDAAANDAGLIANDVYRTSTGELRIKL